MCPVRVAAGLSGTADAHTATTMDDDELAVWQRRRQASFGLISQEAARGATMPFFLRLEAND